MPWVSRSCVFPRSTPSFIIMSALYIQGFFALKNGVRETLPRTAQLQPQDPDPPAYHCNYTTTISCSADNACIPAKMRMYSPITDGLIPDLTIVFLMGKIAFVNGCPSIEALICRPVPGDPSSDT
ncbi:hypothetical protein NMY22_g18459 [Coprinellus aureogranulatus]|nr:hypothetical protein NMY22_g18459 [Coprinellus aureogranulatus]